MSVHQEAIHDEREVENVIRRFALREGLTFATLIGLPERERAIVVASMVAQFDRGADYSERQVNERLQAWLDGAGANVETDRVTLRRWLVDSGVLSRQADCSEYRLAAIDDRLVAIARALDCARLASGAREAKAAERARRKAAWTAAG